MEDPENQRAERYCRPYAHPEPKGRIDETAKEHLFNHRSDDYGDGDG
jgi:hypothetical protein